MIDLLNTRATLRVPRDSQYTPVDQPSTVEIGVVLRDRYVIQGRLGGGSSGSVHKALDRYRVEPFDGNPSVAIKILTGADDNRTERLAGLRREFCRTQTLSHPNIVKVYELDRDGAMDFFTMELLDGELLSNVTERLQISPMSRPYAWRIIQEIGLGLAHAHARNVVHADLTPNNVMITHAGEVRILGFGGFGGLSAATHRYASCEVLDGRPADPRDDLYAFACIAYELLAGVHPFQRRPSIVARDLAIAPQRPSGLSWRQWRTLAVGLSWHRGARSMPVSSWLEQLNAGRVTANRLPGVSELKPAPRRPRRATPLRAASLLAGLLITAGVGVSVFRPAPGQLLGDAAPVSAGPAGAVPLVDAAGAADASPPTPPPTMLKTPRDAERPRSIAARPAAALISADDCQVRSGDHFAEIRVHRSPAMAKDAAFAWWTEAASARPGIDYVHQGKVIQSFPKGKSSTSFFVKLLPNRSRTRSQVFYIAIAGAVPGASSAPAARAAIRLPTTAAPLAGRGIGESVDGESMDGESVGDERVSQTRTAPAD